MMMELDFMAIWLIFEPRFQDTYLGVITYISLQ